MVIGTPGVPSGQVSRCNDVSPAGAHNTLIPLSWLVCLACWQNNDDASPFSVANAQGRSTVAGILFLHKHGVYSPGPDPAIGQDKQYLIFTIHASVNHPSDPTKSRI